MKKNYDQRYGEKELKMNCKVLHCGDVRNTMNSHRKKKRKNYKEHEITQC